MEFSYVASETGEWNPSDHTFKAGTESKWECESDQNKITVMNHSNTDVCAELTYTPETGLAGITGSFENATEGSYLVLSSAVGTTYDKAPTKSALLKLSGALDETKTQSTKIGTITVTLSTVV